MLNKVKMLLMSIFMVISLEKIYRTMNSLKVVGNDGESYGAGLGKPSKRRKPRNFKLIFGIIKFINMGRDRNGKMIIGMSLPDGDQAIVGCLNFDNNFGRRVAKANDIKIKCTGNTWVTIDGTRITALGILITTYSRSHGAARKTAWNALHDFLDLILRDFQDYSDHHKINGVEAIQSGGFHVKGVGGSVDQIFEGFPGMMAGQIELFGPAASTNKNTAHGWKLYSADRLKWVWLKPTGDAHTLLEGFEPGSNQNLSHTEIIGEEEQEESQIIVVRAKG